MAQPTMASLKEIGMQLGLITKKVGSMRNVTVLMNKQRGKLLTKDEIVSNLKLQAREMLAVDNCFHKGYILLKQTLGTKHYFVPDLSDDELKDLRIQFSNLQNAPDEKLKLIDDLSNKVYFASQYNNTNTGASDTSQNNQTSQTSTGQGNSSQNFVTEKTMNYQHEVEMLINREIKYLEQNVLSLEEAVKKLEVTSELQGAVDLIHQQIHGIQKKIESRKNVLSLYQQG